MRLNPKQKIFFAFCIIAGIILRLYALDYRPLHHDESLHAVYAKYIFNDPENGYYQYNPLLHGPFLYNFIRIFYYLFGMHDISARLPSVTVGILLLFFPYFCRRALSATSLLVLTFLISFSPSLIYWSRFIREDAAMILTLLGLFYALFFCKPSWKNFWFSALFIITFTMKENAYVILLLLLGYIFFEKLYTQFFIPFNQRPPTWWDYIKENIKDHPLNLIAGIIVGAVVYCYLYSGGFHYKKGILDGLYRESLSYWMNQHQSERIKGPFLFQFFFLSWYEGLFMLATLMQIILLSMRSSFMLKSTLAAIIPGIIFYFLKHYHLVDETILWNFFKLKIPLDYLGLSFLLIYPLLITIYYLKNHDRLHATLSYLFYASFFTYSYLGEKVPWLALYIFWPGLFYLTSFYQNLILKNPFKWAKKLSLENILLITSYILFAAGLIFTWQNTNASYLHYFILSTAFWISSMVVKKFFTQFNHWGIPLITALLMIYHIQSTLLTNVSRAGLESEFIGQVHTSFTLHSLAHHIRDEILNPIRGYTPKVLVLDDAIWPLSWYFRDLPGFHFNAPVLGYNSYDYVFKNTSIPYFELTHFNNQTIDLRYWWVPDYNIMTIEDFLRYAINHTPWNPPGQMKIQFYVKKSLPL